MRKYEIMYILNQNADIPTLENKIEKILTNNDEGVILEKDAWGIKEFAYPIEKQKRGHYCVLICDTTSENIDELLRIAGITKDIMRILIINTEKEKDYVQSTKLSKTEVKEDKIEHKTIGKKYKKKTFDLNSTSETKDNATISKTRNNDENKNTTTTKVSTNSDAAVDKKDEENKTKK